MNFRGQLAQHGHHPFVEVHLFAMGTAIGVDSAIGNSGEGNITLGDPHMVVDQSLSRYAFVAHTFVSRSFDEAVLQR
jgi:hypothetical protein